MKHRLALLTLTGLVVALHLAWASGLTANEPGQLTAREAFKLAYGPVEKLAAQSPAALEQVSFKNEGHRVIFKIQILSRREDLESLRLARTMAETYLRSVGPGWPQDFVRVQLVGLLMRLDQEEAGCLLAAQALRESDWETINKTEDDFLRYQRERINIEQSQTEFWLKDSLREQIGFYYLNRKTSEGGPNLERAVRVFRKIHFSGNRDNCLEAVRFKANQNSNRRAE